MTVNNGIVAFTENKVLSRKHGVYSLSKVGTTVLKYQLNITVHAHCNNGISKKSFPDPAQAPPLNKAYVPHDGGRVDSCIRTTQIIHYFLNYLILDYQC